MMIQLPELNAFKDIPGYKAILKAVIKSQIQFLVEQLSHQTGEESVLLTASISDGTLSHLGSESGKVFLETNDDFKSQFLGFCIKRHHNTISRAAVRKKPPTAKRSVPFGFNNKAKRQHTDVFPGTVVKTPHLQDEDSQVSDAPNVATNLPAAEPVVETETSEETQQEGGSENKADVDDDDAAIDKTIDGYPVVKQEPVDECETNPSYDTSFDTSLQDLDTSVTNGEMIVHSKKGKKLKLPSEDEDKSFDSEPNISMVKLEYTSNDYMTDEAGSSADTSLNVQEEASSFDYGQGSGALAEHQLFFSQADPTPKKKRQYKHGGSKPCACEFCGRVIKRGSDMKKHLRIHTGMKPFGCDFCGKLFNQSSALSIHRRIHTGEKPYECDNCGVRFRRKDTLTMHQRRCTDENLVRVKKERKH